VESIAEPHTQNDTSWRRNELIATLQLITHTPAVWIGAFGGNPVPSIRAYTVSLLCVVCTERCVTQGPHKSLNFEPEPRFLK